MKTIEKYSLGMGDRFGLQGEAQLKALCKAREEGVDVVPVWNKSHREHTIVHTQPASVRTEADNAVKGLGWSDSYYVDADHIGLKNVDLFIEASDFFTLDVADFIGREPEASALQQFMDRYQSYIGSLTIPGIAESLTVTAEILEAIGRKYLAAVDEAGRIYRRIESEKGAGTFITEVSMDETATPQTPLELLFILAAVADEKIPAQTIAPRFSGRFNKGVDYVGDPQAFGAEFEADLAVIQYAVNHFDLPKNLKLSVHSGSDKFSIYGPIRQALKKYDAGLHLKTAGTTWLEEMIGLAMAGGEALDLVRDIYTQALGRFDELCGPYAEVIDIDKTKLPSAETVATWDSETFAATLRHEPDCPIYNPNVRQLFHVGYKVASEAGDTYLNLLRKHADIVGEQVSNNLYRRHIRALFL